jgi:3-phosphoglycerate kinase
MPIKVIEDLDIKGKRVLVRVDFNVPLNEKTQITDDTRIKMAMPTIKYIISNGGKAILMSHLGRPKGKKIDGLKMNPVAERLSELLGRNVLKLGDSIGDEVKKAVGNMKEGDVILLENLRFHKEEAKNIDSFAKELASLGEVYISDAFGTVHRAHASTVGVAKYLPSAAGFLLKKELEYFKKALVNPARPFITILGGAKVSDKIEVISNLMTKVDILVVGGAMAYTFLKAKGFNTGKSLVEEDKLDLAKELMSKAEASKIDLILPADHIIADDFSAEAQVRKTTDGNIPNGWMGMDVGDKTNLRLEEVCFSAKTIIWNGPVGVFEMKPFRTGSRKIAEIMASSKTLSIIGGGDTVAAVKEFGLAEKMSHVSTGGGASLELLEGKVLPGVDVLGNK